LYCSNKKIVNITVLFVCLVFCISCKHTANTEGASSLHWGFSKPHKNYFVLKPHNSMIKICGSQATQIGEAINDWARHIRRKFRIVETCEGHHISSYSFRDDFSKELCEKYNLQGRAFAQPTKSPMRIVNCRDSALKPSAILHEVGHLFGLCDQYSPQIDKCIQSTDAAHNSLMRSSYTFDSIQSDDSEGLRVLATKNLPEASLTGFTPSSKFYNGQYIGIKTATSWEIKYNMSGGSKLVSIDLKTKTSQHRFRCGPYGICVRNTTFLIPLTGQQIRYIYSDGKAYEYKLRDRP
jgi:hypothetical protein